MDRRTTWVALLLILAFALVAGGVRHYAQPEPTTRLGHQRQMQDRELKQRFEQAVVMLHAKQYDHAITALHRVLELAPRMAEAHVNMGYALVGLKKYDAARGFFLAATEINPRQSNAYYGMALADEARGDLESALGGMRTYLHLGQPDQRFAARARSAIWEWEEKLGRHGAGKDAPEMAQAAAAGAASAPAAPAPPQAAAPVPAPVPARK
jgi:tetratricopeptide (TPR) repeat protein